MRSRTATLVTTVLIVVTGCYYQPRSFSDGLAPFPGTRIALACLDLAVTLTDDRTATGTVVEYSFGNRCWRYTRVDLASVAVVARAPDGTVTPLTAYDPNHELVALRIDPWSRGRELIEYKTADGSAPAEVCIDVGGVDQSQPRAEHWTCTTPWHAAVRQ